MGWGWGWGRRAGGGGGGGCESVGGHVQTCALH